ncbi:MAG: CinA family nicotinamide mononucleotide deamidase-related protein [Muribaculaceae bacterium]|nr:CinA family nicotinamide mononucleotide deamidase-related protein [Muribaculaceae bacterium]
MNYSVIVIGDELLIGQVIDTNSGWIARHLNPFGWKANLVQVIGDDAEVITTAINTAFSHADVVLMTGGLGPTKDDITKATLCKYFGGELVHDETTAQNVRMVMSKRHLTVNEYTQAQAMVPSSCTVIQNEVGTAPIMWFERDGKVLVSMPGVPQETATMMERAVIPKLIAKFHSNNIIRHRTYVTSGIIESQLGIMLNDIENQLPQGFKLAYLPTPGVVRLRLTGVCADKTTLDDVFNRFHNDITTLLGKHILACDDLSIAEILGKRLLEKHLTLATAESCTGGNIAHLITSVAGSSDYYVGSVVSYANHVKVNQLGVSSSVLDREGAVSEPVVEQMVKGVCELLNTDCAIATSGIAGPSGGTPEKPVGTVWMAAKCGEKIVTSLRQFPGDRARVIDRASIEAMLLLINLLQNN